jgi:hypothetical protein
VQAQNRHHFLIEPPPSTAFLQKLSACTFLPTIPDIQQHVLHPRIFALAVDALSQHSTLLCHTLLHFALPAPSPMVSLGGGTTKKEYKGAQEYRQALDWMMVIYVYSLCHICTSTSLFAFSSVYCVFTVILLFSTTCYWGADRCWLDLNHFDIFDPIRHADGSPTSTFGLQMPKFLTRIDDLLESFLRFLGGGEPLTRVIRAGSDFAKAAAAASSAAVVADVSQPVPV